MPIAKRQHPSERLDRSVSRSGKMANVNAQTDALRRQLSPSQRLEAAWVRVCRIYGHDPYNPPPFDRTAFSMGKLDDRK